ncbi:MAG: TolC family protein [Deltaproteobacteria bacterium]|nr:TolC family protein [Deltaproteobacteria bacterium]
MTLKECYQAALNRAETVHISEEEIRAARGRYKQALGVLLPQISFEASEFLQDTSGVGGGSTGVGGTFTRKSRPEAAFTATQNLFQGVKAVSGLKAAKADRVRTQYLHKEAQRLLFADVAEAFYAAASLEKDLATHAEIIGVLKERIDEMKKWVSIGRARLSERLATETELALLSAEEEGIRGGLAVAYEALSFLTGFNPAPRIVLEPSGVLDSLAHYLSVAETRPDVLAAKKNRVVAKGTLGVEKSALAPDVDVTGNYYLYRVGFQNEINWDALFTLNFPLFNMESYGSIQEAKARMKQAEMEMKKSEREAESQVRQAYLAAESALKQSRFSATGAAKARESYLGAREDHRLGLVSNLEVLQAQRTWLAAARLKNAADIRARLVFAKLKATSGVEP